MEERSVWPGVSAEHGIHRIYPGEEYRGRRKKRAEEDAVGSGKPHFGQPGHQTSIFAEHHLKVQNRLSVGIATN